MSRRSGGVAVREAAAACSSPLTAAHFAPIARGGFGDPENTYAHSMAWFEGRLYVGVTRNALSGGRPYDRTKHFHVYPINVPDVPWDLDWRAQIWRFDPRDRRWDRVHLSPMEMGTRGFEIPRHYGFRDMAVFQGPGDAAPALYTASWGSHMGSGPFVLRSADGERFEEVGAGDRALFGTQTLRCLMPFKGWLFTSPTGRCGGMDSEHDQMLVLASRDPARGGWRVASPQFFGDRTNVTVFDMAVLGERLYVGTMNPFEGFQIWRTDAEGEPPFRWSRVLARGAYRGKMNEAGLSLCPFDGALYIGTGIYHCGYDQFYKIGPGSPEVIRLHPDGEWDLLVGEPRRTPDGLKVPLSGLGPGFNNPFAGYLWRMCAHDGWLYAATCVWTPWLPFARYEMLLESVQRVLSEDRMERLMEEFGGFDLWRTRDGRAWAPVTVNGFDNRFNCGARSMASSPYGLFVGTANQFGPEVAVRRAAGWRYEFNPSAGVEVWLGTHLPSEAPITINPEPPRAAAGPVCVERPLPDAVESPLVQAFYESSGWRRVGFWGPRVRTPREACENLMEELLAFTRPDPLLRAPRYPTDEELKAWLAKRAAGAPARRDDRRTAVLDIGCGLGASTRRLAATLPGCDAVGLVESEADLAACERAVPEARFGLMAGTRLRFPAESFDSVFCVEGPGRWGRRAKMLREALRVLKPGGRLVGSDLLRDAEEGEDLPDAAAYASLLQETGFEQVRVIDVTERTIDPFRERCLEFLQLEALAGRADAEGARQALEGLPATTGPAPRYVLLSGVRPGGARPSAPATPAAGAGR